MTCPKCKAPLEAHHVAAGVVVNHCPSCFGVLYRADDLTAPLKLSGADISRFNCPRCAQPMETAAAYGGKLEVDRCPACALLWFDAGEIQILRKLSGVENVAGKPAAPLVPPAKALRRDGPKKKQIDDDLISEAPSSLDGNTDASRSPVVTLDGREYQHFQTSAPVTTSVLGEFPWIAKVGDAARMRDFISPPYLLSQEISGAESVWSAGEYLPSEEVWTAFALPGAPPARIGVAPAQPNPWSEHLWSVWRSFGLAAAACAGAYVLALMGSSGLKVYEGGFDFSAADVERSRVGEVFEVKGRTSNLEIRIDSNLDGHWAYVSMALIDADTDRAIDFGRELSYYHGYEDGESWSEGRARETFYVPSVPSGRYYLRVEPETDAPQLSLRVIVRRNVPLKRLPLIALALLLLPALWAGMRSTAFENTRWMESDHPRTSSGDDEEDE